MTNYYTFQIAKTNQISASFFSKEDAVNWIVNCAKQILPFGMEFDGERDLSYTMTEKWIEVKCPIKATLVCSACKAFQVLERELDRAYLQVPFNEEMWADWICPTCREE